MSIEFGYGIRLTSRWEEFRNIVIPMIKARNPKLTEESIEEILESVKVSTALCSV